MDNSEFMRTLRLYFLIFLLPTFLFLNCSENKTEIVLIIESQLPESLSPNRLNVTGSVSNQVKFTREYNVTSNDFPFEILISSENDTEYTMTFIVFAYRGDNLVAKESVEKSFVKNKREKLVIILRLKDLPDVGFDYGYDTHDITDDPVETSSEEILDVIQDISDDAATDTSEIVCPYGFKDCNKEKDDGCEINILNNNDNCGECNHKCILENAVSECKNGNCIITKCASGFENCDGKDETGCETNLATDSEHCGDCVTNCGDNSVCNNKMCDCKNGFGNCDKLWKNGCETNTHEDNFNCGECKKICPYKTHCAEGKCVCDEGFGDCDGDESNGCETDLNTDINHCGECNKKCQTKNVKTILCENKVCNYDECLISYIDADADRTNGCEEWSYFPKIYRTGNYHTFIYSIYLLENDYYITFLIYSNETKDFKTILSKTDINGNIIWSKCFSKVFYPKFIFSIGKKIFLIGEEVFENSTNLIITELDANGEVIKSKYLASENKLEINSVKTIQNNILMIGEIFNTDIFSYKNGILIKYNPTSEVVDIRSYFETNNEKNNFVLTSGNVINDNILILGNSVTKQLTYELKKGYIINLNNDLSIAKSFSFQDDEIVSFEDISKNFYDKIIIIGNQTNSVQSGYNSIKAIKLFLSGSTHLIEKTSNIYLSDKNIDFINNTMINDIFVIAGLSYNLYQMGRKDLSYHIISLDQDLNIIKGKTFYSDPVYFDAPFGLLNILKNPSNEILTNTYFIAPNSPLSSLIFLFTKELEHPDYCDKTFIYDTEFYQSNQSKNLIIKDLFSSKEIKMNINELDLQITNCNFIQSFSFCK